MDAVPHGLCVDEMCDDFLAVFLILLSPEQLRDDPALSEQNEFIKQYLADQQQLYQQQVEVRRQVQGNLVLLLDSSLYVELNE